MDGVEKWKKVIQCSKLTDICHWTCDPGKKKTDWTSKYLHWTAKISTGCEPAVQWNFEHCDIQVSKMVNWQVYSCSKKKDFSVAMYKFLKSSKKYLMIFLLVYIKIVPF